LFLGCLVSVAYSQLLALSCLSFGGARLAALFSVALVSVALLSAEAPFAATTPCGKLSGLALQRLAACHDSRCQ